uniref:FAR1 domain-containing protein n=1 Tax=Brassica oleracea var. oleracea TaxID=109376 RepID=A0A0D3AAJ8_BRAOL
MESTHLSGKKIVPPNQDKSGLQVSVLAKKDVRRIPPTYILNRKEDKSNNENYLQIEDVDALEANNENQKKHEFCIGMDFSSDESAYKAYRKYGGNHGFDVRRQRTAKKNNKLVRMVYVCSKSNFHSRYDEHTA